MDLVREAPGRVARAMMLAGAAGLVMAGLAIGGLAAAAAAQTSCGEYSFGFQGTRLLNDGISTSAGPFAIELPAGIYDVTMVSHDAHDEHPDQSEQTAEQWFVMLDSGYTSPPTRDIPDDTNDMTTVAAAQEIGDSTAISVHHLGRGGINSVNVVCVGFTTVEVAGPIVEPEEPAETPAEPASEPEAPVAEAQPEPQRVVESPAEPIEPVVASALETAPVSQLARTGPSLLLLLTGIGLSLLGVGVVLAVLDPRSAPAHRPS